MYLEDHFFPIHEGFQFAKAETPSDSIPSDTRRALNVQRTQALTIDDSLIEGAASRSMQHPFVSAFRNPPGHKGG
eukprot:10770563-Alexandrium_andersonii.AAC.1